jgi:addiction module HigA family antidote
MAVKAIHPGEHLAEELETLNMSAAELARNLAVPTNRITEILKGQRAITGDHGRYGPASRALLRHKR